MWKSIVKSNNRIIPEFLYTAISTFIQPTKTREENAVAMEMIAGALRATKDAPQRLLDMLKPALLGCSNGKKEKEVEGTGFYYDYYYSVPCSFCFVLFLCFVLFCFFFFSFFSF